MFWRKEKKGESGKRVIERKKKGRKNDALFLQPGRPGTEEGERRKGGLPTLEMYKL